jgi:SAM-dependent methyltransferase
MAPIHARTALAGGKIGPPLAIQPFGRPLPHHLEEAMNSPFQADFTGTGTTTSNGVILIDPPSAFETLYARARSAENRILTDGQVATLPDGTGLWNAAEWRIRSRSAARLKQALDTGAAKKVLEVGCGNGWLSALLHRSGHQVLGIDIFTYELEQAARVFPAGPRFARCSPFTDRLPIRSFDVIVLAASIQYFQDPGTLMSQLFRLLVPQGSIHIIDSVLYTDQEEARKASLRTARYYASQGIPELAEHYHAHTLDALSGTGRCKVLHAPSNEPLYDRLLRRASPFTHIALRPPVEGPSHACA